MLIDQARSDEGGAGWAASAFWEAHFGYRWGSHEVGDLIEGVVEILKLFAGRANRFEGYVVVVGRRECVAQRGFITTRSRLYQRVTSYNNSPTRY